MITEQQYAQSTDIAHRKRFAQFFTPESIADYMAHWVAGGRKDIRLLDPAYGLGVFSRSLERAGQRFEAVAYEMDSRIYSVAERNIRDGENANIDLRNADYLASPWEDRYGAIVCNPPYLKFHDYDNDRLVPLVNNALGTHLSKFTNLYTLFLMKSLGQLDAGGRCAYIIPSEFLNADYGTEVKRYLLGLDMQLHFIIIDFEENVFDGAITTACIVLAENRASDGQVRFSKIGKAEELETALNSFQSFAKADMRPNVKWKNYYEGRNSERYRHLVAFSAYAKVSRGIATGANKFFSLSKSKAEAMGLPKEALQKCVCHCVDVGKSVFSASDFERLSEQGKAVYLFKGVGNERNPNVHAYINYGERNGIDKRYLCMGRRPWYALEQRMPAPIWVSVFSRKGLKFVRNEAQVSNLTTFHCLYVTNLFVDIDVFYAYLLTDLAYQIFLDNSRQYGNGLVKFEPNDLNNSKVVDLEMLSPADTATIKALYAKYRLDENHLYIEEIERIFERTFTNKDAA